jgi:hypothetical protein
VAADGGRGAWESLRHGKARSMPSRQSMRALDSNKCVSGPLAPEAYSASPYRYLVATAAHVVTLEPTCGAGRLSEVLEA